MLLNGAATLKGMRKVPPNQHTILHAAAYLTTVGVAIAELVGLPLGTRFAMIAFLLVCFGAVLSAIFRLHRTNYNMGWSLALALAASILAVGIMALGPSPGSSEALFFILCAIISMLFSLKVTMGWAFGANAALLFCLLLSGDRNWLMSLLSYDLAFAAFIAFAVAFRNSQQARAESHELLEQLTGAQSRLRELAVIEERHRLAREMHDAVGHRLTAAAVFLESAARLIPTEPLRATQLVETSREQVKQGLDELRTAVSALHAQKQGSQSLSDILAALTDVFAQGAGAKVTLNVQSGMVEPDPDRKLVIVRTAQEALTNAQKHAAAMRVDLTVKAEKGEYILLCRDNGRGIGSEAVQDGEQGRGGFGLRNLRARAAAFGGQVSLEAVPEGGACLRLRLPTASEEHHAQGK